MLQKQVGLYYFFVILSLLHVNVMCCAEVVEHCCSITSAFLGDNLPNIARDMDTYSYRLPLGVTAGITPFNFPAMIPMWVSSSSSCCCCCL